LNIKKETLNTTFSGFSALSAVTGVCVLLWGVFFTSIPEKLISELNTEIQKQNEIQINLVQNNRNLQKNIEISKEVNLNAKQEINSLQLTIEALKNSKLEYEKELKNYRSKLGSSDVARLQNAIFLFGIEINNKLEHAEINAKFGSVYFEMLQWLEQKPEYPEFPDASKYIFQNEYNSRVEKFVQLRDIYEEKLSEWLSIQPDDGSSYLRSRLLKFCSDCIEMNPYKDMSYKEFWHAKMDTFINSKILTTKQLFIETQNELLKDENERVKQKFLMLLNDFISKNPDIFELILYPILSESSTDRHIIESSKILLKNIDKAKETVEAFTNILAKTEI
jgi:hypothetical protein